jgi:GTP-binding protein
MKESNAHFLLGSPSKEFFPKIKLAEYGFVGRSNVGKSSMINFLTGKNKLARISSTPGRTREINFYEVNADWVIADLPGYGYAKISKKERERIQNLIQDYLDFRKDFLCLFVLVDARISPQKSDLDFILGLGKKKIPLAIIYTKADKPGSPEIQRNIGSFEKELLKDWEDLPKSFITSTKKKIGKGEILEYIESINRSNF